MSIHSVPAFVAKTIDEKMLQCALGKARGAEQMIRNRFIGRLKSGEIDLVFVHYVHGLISAMWPGSHPHERIAMLRRVAEEAISPAAVEAAIRTAPDADQPVLSRVIRAVEAAGLHDAEVFQSKTL